MNNQINGLIKIGGKSVRIPIPQTPRVGLIKEAGSFMDPIKMNEALTNLL
jgi:hypothetical protein